MYSMYHHVSTCHVYLVSFVFLYLYVHVLNVCVCVGVSMYCACAFTEDDLDPWIVGTTSCLLVPTQDTVLTS